MSSQDKKLKKKAGRCPICNLKLHKDEDELLEKIGLDKSDLEGEVTAKDIKNSFKETAKLNHPDKPNGDPEAFQEAKEARDELLERLSEGELELEKEEKPSPTGKEILQALHAIKRMRQIKKEQKHTAPCPYCRQKPKSQT